MTDGGNLPCSPSDAAASSFNMVVVPPEEEDEEEVGVVSTVAPLSSSKLWNEVKGFREFIFFNITVETPLSFAGRDFTAEHCGRCNHVVVS
mgnify:CR=1 FL=1